jgi:manganese transport protein
MIALLVLSRRKSVAGDYATKTPVFLVALAATIVVLSLNIILIAQTLGVPLPGMAST